MDYSEEELRSILPLLKEKLAGRSMLEVALQYNLANPAVASVIAGASRPEQIRENAQAVSSVVLSENEITFIKKMTKQSVYKEHR